MGGLEVLISVYCSRDQNFDPARFQSCLEAMEFKAKHARILYNHLQTIRRDAESFTVPGAMTTPPTASTCISTNYSESSMSRSISRSSTSSSGSDNSQSQSGFQHVGDLSSNANTSGFMIDATASSLFVLDGFGEAMMLLGSN